MSVFTLVRENELSDLLKEAGLQLLAFRPASAGIENSNYLIDANDQRGQRADVVLTLFERLPATALLWYAEVLSQAAATGLPVPCPLAHPRGTIWRANRQCWSRACLDAILISLSHSTVGR